MDRKVALVTGSSRGIGAATAIRLAARGCDVIVNYRNKSARAERVVESITAAGRIGIALRADLTVEAEVVAMMASIRERFAGLDILVLNASGGLEKGKAEDYAMSLNDAAQGRMAKLALPLMAAGGRIVFVTSHWAHFWGQKPVLAEYEAVARGKHAGERSLREFAKGELARAGVSLVVVSGDVIEGTITPRLLERGNPGMMERRRNDAEGIPSVEEFAEAIACAAVDRALPSGHTAFVGSTEY